MPFSLRITKKKIASVYKSIYLSEVLVKRVEQLAIENDTSFNNMVASMIEYCLKEMEQE